jgi:hypothetical protein
MIFFGRPNLENDEKKSSKDGQKRHFLFGSLFLDSMGGVVKVEI